MASVLTPNSLNMSAALIGTLTQTLADGSVQSDPFTGGAFQGILPVDASLFFHNQYVIASAATQTLDLKNLVDALGNAVAFSTVYAIFIQNLETASGRNLFIGNSNFATWLGAATHKVLLGPKGCFFLASNVDGYAVVVTTGNSFSINNTAGGQNISTKVIIAGK